ncbi:hypothetical protein MNBD_NITROSPINAE02-436 [hydrothermal vent metagenome]|uniref:Histidine kinase n=1 Tax=hydrothermal vent metagenome TaxID=652676 RepID=A0A3B1CPJ5_9ZZZZ
MALGFFRNLVEQSPNAVFVAVHETGKILDVNERACEMLSYSKDEFLEMSISSFERVIPSDLPLTLHLRTLTQKKWIDFESRYYRKDGAPIPVEANARYTTVGGEKFTVITARPISGLKLAATQISSRAHQQAVQAQFAMLAVRKPDLPSLMDEAVAHVAQGMGVGYAMILKLQPDGETMLLKAGVGWKEGLVGRATMDAKQYTSMASKPVIVEDVRPRSRYRSPKLLYDHDIVGGVSVIIHGKNKPFGVLGAHTGARRVFTLDDISFLLAISHILASVIESARMEEELLRINQAVDNANDAIVITDENLKPVYTNEAYNRLFTDGSDMHDENRICGFLPVEQYQAVIRRLEEKGSWSAQFDVKKNSGLVVPVYARATRIQNIKGEIVGAFAIVADITERRRAEETEKMFRQAQKREAIGTLASGIAHDFNNILQRVVGFADLLKGRLKKGSKDLRYADIIKTSGILGSELVKGILAFTGQRSDTVKKTVDIKSVVEESLVMLQHALPSTIKIEKYFSPEPCAVFADASRIQQVVTNICINAAHAMPDGGVLRIELSRHEACIYRMDDAVTYADGKQCDILCPSIHISISDTGEGIDESIRSRVFDPYFTTKAPRDGTGLGLSIVHRIVKEIGGYISFISSRGAGTTFTICFPLSGEQVEPEITQTDTTLIQGGKRILVVDDDAYIVEFVTTALSEQGYEVICCSDSAEALSAFLEAPEAFDIIVTDLTMPGLTGIELALRIKATRPDIPIILCTGYRSKVTKEEIKKSGIAKVMIKPISTTELSFAIGRLSGNTN